MLKSYDEAVEEAKQYIKEQQENKRFWKRSDLVERAEPLYESDPLFARHIVSHFGANSDNGFMLDFYFSGKYPVKELGERFVRHSLDEAAKIEKYILTLDLSKPRCDLSDDLIETKRKGKVSYSYDYCPVVEKIESVYGFKMRGVYDEILHGREFQSGVLKELGFTQEQIDIGRMISPAQDNDVARLYAMFSAYDDDLVPYLDFWHHLLDTDFVELRRGGVNYMSVNSSENEHPIFKKFREILVLECDKAVDEYREFVNFDIDW